MIDGEKLREVLKEGIVEISFISLKSGQTRCREYTLNDTFMGIPNHVNKQSGDKILCYDVEFKRWEDIQVDTIESYKPLEKL
tara:strand:+ start:1229 stop:1474 length:246 start_codon:yes stop_codon:yes gene_type:complete